MHLVVVIQPALLLVTFKPKGYKLLHDHRPFRSTMAKLGKSFVADEELLHEGEAAVCALYGRLQEYALNGLIISCLGREQQTQRSCHHAKMHATNTSSVLTIRQPFGGAAWRHDHQRHPIMAMDRLLTETFWYIGRTVLQLNRQYLNVLAASVRNVLALVPRASLIS